MKKNTKIESASDDPRLTFVDFIELKGRLGKPRSLKMRFFIWFAQRIVSAISFDPQSRVALRAMLKKDPT